MQYNITNKPKMPSSVSSKIKAKARQLPHRPGVYLMKDRLGGIIYVGKAKDLKKRVGTYFQPSRRLRHEQPKVAAMIELIRDFDFLEVKSEAEAILLEGKLIKEWKPKYNTDFIDDKRFLLVRLDLQSEIPRFRLTRLKKDVRSIYFGPFAHAGLLRKTLAEMRLKFGILLGDTHPQHLPDGTWKLYDDMRSEIYGHNNRVTADEFRGRVEEACSFLEGKSREWLAELKEKMRKASQDQKYEKAAELRDVAFALENTLLKTRKFARDPFKTTSPETILKALREALDLPVYPRHVECFDISHISGTFVVASMVQFTDGRPDKNQYRRYKIKGAFGNDDYRAIEEVVSRRYRRLQNEGKPFPDLVVIDGGRGQLGAAMKAFLDQGLKPPPLIGLAKKRETVHFTDMRPPLNLPPGSEALHLLQRLRDEAHRFANDFNAEARRKRLKETLLDDFEGLGPVRRQALLKRFKSLTNLKKATPEQLRQVEGIGPKLAARLHAFLGQ